MFLGTGLLLVLAIWAIAAHFLNVHDRVWESRNRNRQLYAELVAERIGTPPNLEVAKQIVAQTGMDLKIQGSDCDFATQPISPIEHPEAGHRCVWEPRVKVVSRGGRIFVELLNAPFLFKLRGTPDQYKAGLEHAIEHGWIVPHESGTRFTQAGADLFA